MGRIITPDGFIPGQDGKPDRPPTMQERITSALEHWKYKRRDEAFATSLNCIAFMSNGLAGLAKSNEALRVENEQMRSRVDGLQLRIADLTERLRKLEGKCGK